MQTVDYIPAPDFVTDRVNRIADRMGVERPALVGIMSPDTKGPVNAAATENANGQVAIFIAPITPHVLGPTGFDALIAHEMAHVKLGHTHMADTASQEESRQQELAADLEAAKAGYGPGLLEANRRTAAFYGNRPDDDQGGHPTFRARDEQVRRYLASLPMAAAA